MSKREKCRNCDAVLRHDETSDQYDPDYCSGKCRAADGEQPYVPTEEQKAKIIKAAKANVPATYEDYKKNVGARYARRNDPEKLNWSQNIMNEHELEQAGFRANREPIPGDWDYKEIVADETGKVDMSGDIHPKDIVWPPRDEDDWDWIRAQAKRLGIPVHGKKKAELLAEVKEAENDA